MFNIKKPKPNADLKICRDSRLFKGNEYEPVSYNVFIWHALWNCIKQNDGKEKREEIKKYLKKIRELSDKIDQIGSLESNRNRLDSTIDYHYLMEDFIEIYILYRLETHIGLVIVDKTDGCYPLVLYLHQQANDLTKKCRVCGWKKL